LLLTFGEERVVFAGWSHEFPAAAAAGRTEEKKRGKGGKKKKKSGSLTNDPLVTGRLIERPCSKERKEKWEEGRKKKKKTHPHKSLVGATSVSGQSTGRAVLVVDLPGTRKGKQGKGRRKKEGRKKKWRALQLPFSYPLTALNLAFLNPLARRQYRDVENERRRKRERGNKKRKKKKRPSFSRRLPGILHRRP